MSTQYKAPRSTAEIQQEYTNVAAQLGQKDYQKFVLDNDIALLRTAMRDLNAEAFAFQEEANKKAQADAEAKKQAEESAAKEESPKEESPKKPLKAVKGTKAEENKEGN